MPKNNSKARRKWRRDRAHFFKQVLSPEERLLLAIFGNDKFDGRDDAKPGVEH